jgi:dihydrofolate synthase/folylpolyglutamate synthase
VRPAIEATPGITWFEIVTAIAFDHFAASAVDVAVVEVGLGGRLDATNVLTPLVSVITSLSLDHTQLLGDTLAQIAAEKGGIIKPGVPVVTAPQAAGGADGIGTHSRRARRAADRRRPRLALRSHP